MELDDDMSTTDGRSSATTSVFERERFFFLNDFVRMFSVILNSMDHFPNCLKHVYQRTIYPEPQSDESIVKWKSREKTERVPLLIYADFESCLVLVHDDSGVLDEHVPSGFCVYTVSADTKFETGPVTYSGRDCMTISLANSVE
jgi:hypothetical protein